MAGYHISYATSRDGIYGSQMKGKSRRVQVSSCGEGKPETRETGLDSETVSALRIVSKWSECHEVSYLLSNHHLRRLNTKMFSKFLSLSKSHRKNRSKARSEINPIEGQSELHPAVPRPTESAPDLRIGTSTLPMPSPPNGM